MTELDAIRRAPRVRQVSGEKFLNRLEADVLRARSRFDVMERPSRRRAIDSLGPVNAHRRVNRAGDVFHIDRAGARPAGVDDLPARVVGLADDRAAFDAAARQHARMNLHVMLAPLARLADRSSSAAELAHRYDQSLVEQRLAGTVFGWNAVEVFDQIAERDVEFADQHRVVARTFLVYIAVMIPT